MANCMTYAPSKYAKQKHGGKAPHQMSHGSSCKQLPGESSNMDKTHQQINDPTSKEDTDILTDAVIHQIGETTGSPDGSLDGIISIFDESLQLISFRRSSRRSMNNAYENMDYRPLCSAGSANQNNNSLENDEDHLQELTPTTETVPNLRTICTQNYERFNSLIAAVNKQQSDESETQEEETNTQNVTSKSEGKIQVRTKRKRKLYPDTTATTCKLKQDFALIPLNYGRYGELMQRGPGGKPKYTDVASVIDQGTIVHGNLNTLSASKHSCLITLDSSKVLSEEKLYYVKPILVGTVHLEDLMVQNDERQLFSEEEARFVCANLLVAAQFLHRYTIIHGSISPGKIVFSDKGYPYLAYFNTAERISQRHSRPRETVPIEYSSPEQLLTKLYSNTDEFAIAAVIYEMIFGRAPYAGENYTKTRRNLYNFDYVPEFDTSLISTRGRKFLKRCLRGCHLERFNLLHLGPDLFQAVSWFKEYDENLMFLQALDSPMKSKVQQLRGRLRSEATAGTSAETQ